MPGLSRQADALLEKKDKGLTVYEFPNLAAYGRVRHGIFTRHGGFSRGAYQSLNVAYGIGDSDESVRRNRERISAYFQDGRLVFSQQVHGTGVRVIDPYRELPEDRAGAVVEPGDAMITNAPGMYLVIQIADCQAVMIYDPVRHAAANIHAGWRGTMQNIIGKTVRVMENHFNSSPVDLRVGIGPSLGPCCAEFVNYRREIPEKYWQFKDDAHRFDLWAISHHQLREAGIPAANIAHSRCCTRCREKDFFSYRRAKNTGRFAAVIGLA